MSTIKVGNKKLLLFGFGSIGKLTLWFHINVQNILIILRCQICNWNYYLFILFKMHTT